MDGISKTIKVSVIATGARARVLVKSLLKDTSRCIEIVSVFDPDRVSASKALTSWGFQNAKICESFEEALNEPDIDWALIFSPNAYHKEHILGAFARGLHVFAEKPLAITINDCQEIYKAHSVNKQFFATGFVLRYAPIYREAKRILASGKLGKILNIQANENIAPAHGGYIMRNWRRYRRLAGPHILEKCCHDLDLINWFCESLPSRVSAFHSRDFFIKENEALLEKYGEDTFMLWPDPQATGSPFTSEKDLMDNHVGIFEYRNGIKATFQATLSNAMPERRMYISCTEGTLTLEVYSGRLVYQSLRDKEATVLEMKNGLHGGGDSVIMNELYETMTLGTAPTCSGVEGLESAVTALSMDDAAQTGQVIDLEPTWKLLQR